MKNFVEEIVLATTQEAEFTDITAAVRSAVSKSGIRDGLVVVTSRHTTAAVVLNEKEPGLQKDMLRFLNRVAPRGRDYAHDVSPQDGRINAHSHLQSLLLPPGQILSLVGGELRMGAWQTLFFLELDGPRPNRRVTVQILGV